MASVPEESSEIQRSFPTIHVNYANRQEIQRPSWDDYFLDIAVVVARRSHDAQTQIGAILVDANNRILATGYNGFPPGCDDQKLPNLRPDKYPFMVHAEVNAIASSRQDLRGSTLYVTHTPCRECAKAVVTAGVKAICFRNHYLNDDFNFVNHFFAHCGVELRHIPQKS